MFEFLFLALAFLIGVPFLGVFAVLAAIPVMLVKGVKAYDPADAPPKPKPKK